MQPKVKLTLMRDKTGKFTRVTQEWSIGWPELVIALCAGALFGGYGLLYLKEHTAEWVAKTIGCMVGG